MVERGQRLDYLIKYGRMDAFAWFASSLPAYARGQRVVVRSERGLESGIIVQVRGAEPGPSGHLGSLVGPLTAEFQVRWDEIAAVANRAFAGARALLRDLALPLEVVDAEPVLDPDTIYLHGYRWDRADERDLVSRLARELDCQIRWLDLTDPAKVPAGANHGSCGGCGSGGCGTGCGSTADFESQWTEYFAERRRHFERRVPLPTW